MRFKLSLYNKQIIHQSQQSLKKNQMSNHHCSAKSITDLLACQQCGANQICCKQCFSSKHRSQGNQVHLSCKLVDSDVYKSFLKLIHVEWLVGQKLLKSLGGFQVTQANKEYMVNAAFYGSEFYKEFFRDQLSAQQYGILKCYYSNKPQPFDTLQNLSKLLGDAKSMDVISKHISKLTQPTEQEKIMNSHINFYIGADIYYLAEFISNEQQMFNNHLTKINEQGKEFSIYSYIEEREKTERNPTYYSNQFTAFLIEYYRRDAAQKELFSIQDYVLNYWQFFNTAVQINPTLRQYSQSEVAFYKQYEELMTSSSLTVTPFGFKIWKLNNGVSQQLPYLKNHYFLFAFIQGYLKMLIERTYMFLTQEEKQQLSIETWLDFVKFIKDYSLLLQDKNANLKAENKISFDFDNYKIYYLYRKRMEGFHDAIKASKDNIYDKEVAVKFFNAHFETNIQLKPKLYKEFFEKLEVEKRKKEQQLLKQVDQLKQQLQQQEKEDFYQFVFINFVAYCREQDISIKKETYHAFKKNVFENMDQEYLRLTEEKFKRGDFNEPAEQVEEVSEEKVEEPKVIIGETGAKITVGMDKFEQQILETKLHENEQEEGEMTECPCCHDDIYNCENAECSMMGYCTLCSDS